jgi:hypothetical protein
MSFSTNTVALDVHMFVYHPYCGLVSLIIIVAVVDVLEVHAECFLQFFR